MNKKGEVGIGILLSVAIAVIVGLVLLQTTAQQVGVTTNTLSLSNALFTAGADGSVIELTGQELLSVPTVTNRTDGVAIAAGNYTIAECVRPSDSLKGICYTTVGTEFENVGINVSYSYGADGYIDSSGGRSVAGLIIFLAAIAIALIAFGAVKTKFD